MNKMQTQNNHFTFVVTSYNCEKWVDKNLTSIIDQKYKIDISRNSFNKGKMENVYNCIRKSKEGTIIIIVDGDDWLTNKHVLSLLNNVYKDDVWMTNGSYEVVPDVSYL